MATVELSRDSKENRLERLKAEDAQFRDSYQRAEVTAVKRTPGIRLAQVVQGVMEGYADRPALGRRATELVVDPAMGRATLRLLPPNGIITPPIRSARVTSSASWASPA